MTRMVKKRSQKAGLPPGSLVYLGDKGAGAARITVVEYQEGMVREATLSDLTECFPCSDAATVTWIDVNSVHQVELVAKVGECFGLHPLVVEDILNTDQRPKLEDFGEYLYIVFRAFSCNGSAYSMDTEQISLILGPNFVISFQEKESMVFDDNSRADQNRQGAHCQVGCRLSCLLPDRYHCR